LETIIKCQRSSQDVFLFFKTTKADLDDVSSLVLSSTISLPAAAGGGVVGSYQLLASLPTRVEVELGCENY
jgi:hypothetical protein